MTGKLLLIVFGSFFLNQAAISDFSITKRPLIITHNDFLQFIMMIKNRSWVTYFLNQTSILPTTWVSNRWFNFCSVERQKWLVLHSEKPKPFLIDQGGVNYFDHEQFFIELQKIGGNPSKISMND